MEKGIKLRLIDFVEAVMERPRMYTVGGSFPEAVAFLDGCQVGFAKAYLKEDSRYGFGQDMALYQAFKTWVQEKLELDEREVFQLMSRQPDPFLVFLGLYREFKPVEEDQSHLENQ